MFSSTERVCEDLTTRRSARFKGSCITTACHTVQSFTCTDTFRDHFVLHLELCRHIKTHLIIAIRRRVCVCMCPCVCVSDCSVGISVWKWV